MVVQKVLSLKYLSNFWKTLEMPLINYEINLILTWSEKCVLSNDTKATTFAITLCSSCNFTSAKPIFRLLN